MIKKKHLASIALVGLIGLSVFFGGNLEKEGFPEAVKKCNRQAAQLRFSCYRSALEKYFGKDYRQALSFLAKDHLEFESDDTLYAIFGTSCHTFYHAVGDFMATYSEEFDENLINQCPTACTSGCMMGLYKRTALKNKFSEDLLKKFYEVCRNEEKKSCAHEIGHLLHDKYVYSILKILDDLSIKNYSLKPAADYQYQTFQRADLNSPFEVCKKLIPEKHLSYCFTGIGHNLFLFSEFSPEGYKTQFKECENVEPANREKCHSFLLYRIGINEAAPKFLSSRFEEGIKVCQEAISTLGRQDLRQHCYIGLGGGIGLFIESEFLYSEITEEKLPGVRSKISELAVLCESAEKGFVEECYRGLLGTRFKNFYETLNLHNESIERILPSLDQDFEVVG